MNQYDSIAQYYEELMGDKGDLPNQHLLDPILLDLLPKEKDRIVLDFGCGSGRWTKVLAAKYQSVKGIDKAQEMLQIAKRMRTADNITYTAADLENELPFPDESFDLEFANMVVHYVAGLEGMAKELYRVAKPGCMLMFSTHHPTFDLARYEFLSNATTRTEFTTTGSLKGKVSLERFYEPWEQLIAHFTTAGFHLRTQQDAIITAEFAKIYPRYQQYVGLPRFTVLQFTK